MVVEDDKQYKRITIKTNCGGIFVRDEVSGKEIKTKNQYYVKAGQLAVSKIDARNGADKQIRTADLILTKNVLCLLSYISKLTI